LLEEQAGAGGMAVVYRARDEVLGRLVAVKVLSPTLAADQDFRTRFLRESRAIAAVDEPHVLPVYAAGEANGVLYIATRFVAGGDLATMLREGSGPLAPGLVASLIGQVSAALDAAHAIGLVHRDVKPANILIDLVPGRPEQAYLSDFGLTKASTGATGLTATGMFMGTPDYCAPEQILGRPVDGRADQYALACVAFNVLTGTVPYQREETISTLFAHVRDPIPTPTAIRSELPAALDAALGKAMAKDPAERYASCGQFAAALRGVLVMPAQPTPVQPVPPVHIPTQVAHPSQPFQPQPFQPQPPVSPAVGSAVPTWAAPPPVLPGYFAPGGTPPGNAMPPYLPGGTPPGTGVPGYPPGGLPGGGVPGGGVPGGSVPGGSVPGGSVPGGTPPPAFPYGQAPSPYTGSPIAPQPPVVKKKGNAKIIAIVAAAVVIVAGGIGAGLALSGPSHSTSSAKPPPVLVGATRAATFASPVGGTMTGAIFSPDGTLIAAEGGPDHKANIYIFSASTRKYISTIKMSDGGTGIPLTFTPDDQGLIAVDEGPASTSVWKIYEFSVKTGQHGGGVTVPYAAYDVDDDGSVEANETENAKYIDVWDLLTGVHTGHFKNPTTAGTIPNSLYVDSNGQEMLISAENGEAYVMSTQTGQTTVSFPFHYVAGGDVPVLSPDGKTVYIPAHGSTAAQIWNVASQTNVTPRGRLWTSKSFVLSYSTDGGIIITGVEGTITNDLWNVALGSHVTTLTIPGSTNWGVEDLGPSGDEVLYASAPNKSGNFTTLYLYSVP
jgi:serine/threonine-protein kinase